MLEFPSLVFVLAALYCIRHLERGYPLGRALLFGVFTAAAMWTKQHAVFLALVPVFWILLSRRWGMLLRTGMWISSAITVASVAGLVLLSMPFNHAGTNRVSTSVPSFVWNLGWNVRYYREWLGRNVLGLPVVFAVCALAVYLFTRHRRPAREFPLKLYFAWLLSVPVVLLLVSAASGRYLIYLFPAVITLGYLMLWEGCSCLWGERRASYILAGFAAAWFAAGSFAPLDYLRGPAQAAAFVAKDGPTRVLYAGEADGNFIFALRSLDPSLRSVVVPGDKLQPPTFQPAALERFCRTYGIRWVVFENGTTNPHKWDALSDRQAPSMRLERSIPMETSRSRWQGYKIDIYRFDGPVDPPGGVLKLPVWKLGVNLDVKL
jgi:hypothetical protein